MKAEANKNEKENENENEEAQQLKGHSKIGVDGIFMIELGVLRFSLQNTQT